MRAVPGRFGAGDWLAGAVPHRQPRNCAGCGAWWTSNRGRPPHPAASPSTGPPTCPRTARSSAPQAPPAAQRRRARWTAPTTAVAATAAAQGEPVVVGGGSRWPGSAPAGRTPAAARSPPPVPRLRGRSLLRWLGCARALGELLQERVRFPHAVWVRASSASARSARARSRSISASRALRRGRAAGASPSAATTSRALRHSITWEETTPPAAGPRPSHPRCGVVLGEDRGLVLHGERPRRRRPSSRAHPPSSTVAPR